jgi:hypothetical protein
MRRILPTSANERQSRKLRTAQHPMNRLLAMLPLLFLLQAAQAQITISFDVTEPLCFGLPIGSVTATASGGTGPYTYMWSTGQMGPTLSGITAGSYTVTVTDAAGGNASSSVVVNQPTLVTVSLTANVCAQPFVLTAQGAGGISPYTYTWGNSMGQPIGTGPSITVANPGTYCVTVTDQNLCAATDCITVAYNPLNVNVVVNNLTCPGGNDGQVTATHSGGTPPFTYLWSNGAVTAAQSNLSAGTYTVTVIDGAGCTASASGTVQSPPALVASISSSDPSCAGSSNGSAMVSAMGGTPPYFYLWSNGSMGASITGLTAGTYSVTVTDSNNCPTTASVTLTPVSSLIAIMSATPQSCPDVNDGTATAMPSASLGPYTYLWSNGGVTQTITGLAPGTYSVTIIDGAGCTATGSVAVTAAPALEINVTATGLSTCGATDGAATANVLQGQMPLTFAWSNGGTGQTISGLGAGVYTVTVTDANGCTTTGTTAISEPPAISVLVIASDTICPGANDGEAAAIVSGGTMPISFLWNTGATTASISGLAAGTYSVTVTDANNCQATGTATIVEAAPFTVNIIGTETVCQPESSGQATANVMGGSAPFTYLWSNGATSQSISDLPEGSYSVTVTDANGCVAIGEIDVDVVDDFDVNAVITNISCPGANDGAIALTPVGGSAPYTYLWSNGATSATVSNLAPSTYMVTVTEGSGCQLVRMYMLSEPPALTATASGTNPACPGSASGTATVVASGGTPPYTYLWSNGATTASVGNLLGGTYGVTVTDSQMCTATAAVTLVAPPQLIINLVTQNVLCAGEPTGGAIASPVGGTPPYTYAWSTGATSTAVNDLPAGVYGLTVTDANGCTVSTSFIVNEVPMLMVDLDITNIFCEPTPTGALDATVTGGIPPYTYLWSNGVTTPLNTGLLAGDYTLTVTDANGCVVTITGTVEEFPGLVLSPIATSPRCFGESTGAVAVVAGGGTPPFTYLWNTGSTASELLNIPAGVYSVTVTDAVGCTGEETIGLAEPAELVALIAPNEVTNVSCNSFTDGEATVTPIGGTPPYTIAWSNGQMGATATNLAAGTYSATVTDANDCEAIVMVTITEPPAFNVDVVATNASTCSNTSDGSAAANPVGGTPPYTFLWSTGSTNASVSGLAAGSYTVTVTDGQGCTAIGTVTIQALPVPTCTIAITNQVSPAGNDGAAEVTPIGGTPPYTFVWSNGQTGPQATGLVPGTYSATVTDANGCQTTCSITLAPPSRIGDFVWNDRNRNGVQDPGEPGIPGVMVILQIPAENDPIDIDTTFTNANGLYFFDVLPGEYKVKFILPSGLIFTEPFQGGDPARDSDPDPVTGMTDVFVINPGESNLTIDAGLYTKCDNITNPGLIGPNQFLCGPGNQPAPIENLQLPSGGSGAIEYLWMKSTQPGPFNVQTWTPIPDATGPSYAPPVLYETTYYARCARRECCIAYLETNIVVIEVGSVASANIQGPSFLCVGETADFFAVGTGPGAVINWSITGPVTPLAATGPQVSLTATGFGMINITLTVTENNCTASNIKTLSATNSPIYCGQLLPIIVQVTNEKASEVMVSWVVEEVLRGQEYTVEYSKDGTNFEPLGRARAPRAFQGSMSYYEFMHYEAVLGLNFYRVRIDAPDGQRFYSEIGDAVLFGASEVAMAYPNPTTDWLILEIFETFGVAPRIEIYSANGARMWEYNVPAGQKRLEIDVANYPAGTYFVRLNYGKTGQKILKVLKH